MERGWSWKRHRTSEVQFVDSRFRESLHGKVHAILPNQVEGQVESDHANRAIGKNNSHGLEMERGDGTSDIEGRMRRVLSVGDDPLWESVNMETRVASDMSVYI